MPLEILALLVIVGVGGVVLAIHMTGGTVTATLSSDADAIRRFQVDFANARVNNTVVTEDRRAAFLGLQNGDIGIVHAIGDRFLTRYLSAASGVACKAEGQKDLSVQIDDMSWRGAKYRFASASDRDNVAVLFAPVAKGDRENG